MQSSDCITDLCLFSHLQASACLTPLNRGTCPAFKAAGLCPWASARCGPLALVAWVSTPWTLRQDRRGPCRETRTLLQPCVQGHVPFATVNVHHKHITNTHSSCTATQAFFFFARGEISTRADSTAHILDLLVLEAKLDNLTWVARAPERLPARTGSLSAFRAKPDSFSIQA